MSSEDSIVEIIGEINDRVKHLEMAIEAFSRERENLENLYQRQGLKISAVPPRYWRFVGVHDALAIFLQFINSDIASTTELELAQKARYICDASMWIKHLCLEDKDPLEYYEHLLRAKRFHYTKVVDFMKREVKNLNLLQRQFEMDLSKAVQARIAAGLPEPTQSEVLDFISRFDLANQDRFSIYRKASSGNYGEYAQKLETEVLPGYLSDLETIDSNASELEAVLNRPIAKNHNSSHFAASVGMTDEYDFLFRLTSQHIHATPVSMSTEMKNISSQEKLIFLEYIRSKISSALSDSLYLMQDFKRASPRPLTL